MQLDSLFPEANSETSFRLNSYFKVLRADEDSILVSVFGSRRLLKLPAHAQVGVELLKFLESPRTLAELETYLLDSKKPDFLKGLLEQVKKQGGLFAMTSRKSARRSTFRFLEKYTNLSESLETFETRLLQTRLKLVTNLRLPASFSSVRSPWKSIEVTRELSFGPDLFPVIVADVSDKVYLDHLNQVLTQEKKTALLVLVDPFGAVIGPLVGPEGQPCLQCLFLREQSVLKGQFKIEPTDPSFDLGDWPDFFWMSLEGALQSHLVKIVGQHALSDLWQGRMVYDLLNSRSAFETTHATPGCWACQTIRTDP